MIGTTEQWTARKAAALTFVRRARRVGPEAARWRFHVGPTIPTLLPAAPVVQRSSPSIDHVAFYTRGNAGDTVLVAAVRAAFEQRLGAVRWHSEHAHWRFEDRSIARANAADLVVVGGGGLFLADTNPNARSGWQWNAAVEAVERVTTPLAVFAVGYNRFRGQDEFAPVFTEHLTALAGKAVYLGMRNRGSIDALARYLPAELHGKLRYQPCPTTVLSCLDPTLVQPLPARPSIGVNLAFDRPHLRFAGRTEEILANVGAALRVAEQDGATITFLAQCPEDELTIDRLGPLRTVRVEPLYGLPPREVAAAYGRPSVVLGMRGHSQMIPFGLGRPIVSLITHDKLRFFLDDIDRPEWGVEAMAPDLTTRLVERLRAACTGGEAIAADIAELQSGLWQTTAGNVDELLAERAGSEAGRASVSRG